MTKSTKSIEIEASPEKVFTFVNDIEKMNKIGKGFFEGEYISKGPVGVGTTIHFVGKAGGSQAEYDMEYTEFEKNKKMISHSIRASKLDLKTWWTLEPTAKGTKVTHGGDYKLPYSILGKILDKLWTRRNMEKTIEKILEEMKKALEP